MKKITKSQDLAFAKMVNDLLSIIAIPESIFFEKTGGIEGGAKFKCLIETKFGKLSVTVTDNWKSGVWSVYCKFQEHEKYSGKIEHEKSLYGINQYSGKYNLHQHNDQCAVETFNFFESWFTSSFLDHLTCDNTIDQFIHFEINP